MAIPALLEPPTPAAIFGAAQQHARAEPRQQQHVRARNAAVQNVAYDAYSNAGQRLRIHRRSAGRRCARMVRKIEQRLGGMFVHTVAGVDHRQARFSLQQPGRAGGAMAQNNGFGAQRTQREARVFQRLALLNARTQA